MSLLKRSCSHRSLRIATERDRCTWVECRYCGKQGPAKHSVTLALLAWIVALADKHPRKLPLLKNPPRKGEK